MSHSIETETTTLKRLNAFLRRTATGFNLWLALFICGAMGAIDFADNIYVDFSKTQEILYIITISGFRSGVIYLFYIVCSLKKYLKPFGVITICLYIILSIVNYVCYRIYGFGISQKMFHLIYQTDWAEISDFVSNLGVRLLLFFKRVEVWGVLTAFFAILFISKYVKVICRQAIIIFLFLSGAVTAATVYFNYGFLFRQQFITYRTYLHAKLAYRADKEFEREMMEPRDIPDAENISSLHHATNIIVVIGESASRTHMSLYGYQLPTTPRMDSISDNLIIFKNAISSSITTYKNMARILSFLPDNDNEDNVADYPLLIDVFKQAGYKTYWISNQSKTGLMSQRTTLITSHADESVFVAADDADEFFLYKFDEALIPEYRRVINESGYKMIFLHLMGSHQEYKHRFPKTRRLFSPTDELSVNHQEWMNETKASLIADYDNSILYTDSVLNEILEVTRRLPDPTVLLYFSDHGEIVYDLGDFNGRTDLAVEVPFIIFANDAYTSSHKDMTEYWKTKTDSTFSTANMAHSLLTITGTSYSYYDPSLDVLSDSFVRRPLYIDNKQRSLQK